MKKIGMSILMFLFVLSMQAECTLEVTAQILNADGTGELSGSAPMEIIFRATSNYENATYNWKIMRRDPVTNEETLAFFFRDTAEKTQIFNQSGTFIIYLEVLTADPDCYYEEEMTEEITISESDLKLANFFSPGSSIGSNDIYRVSHKSIIKFKASIYNRNGNLLFHWENPADGWDGRVGGKYVPSGVYFIVVQAEGADGKHYNLSSDINILRSKNEM
jgi:gliding motility-associated-like protein